MYFKRYCELKLKNKAKFCVQICPIFAGPVTYYVFYYTGGLVDAPKEEVTYSYVQKTELTCIAKSSPNLGSWFITLCDTVINDQFFTPYKFIIL